MLIRKLVMAAVIGTVALGAAAPAFADGWGHRDRREHEWREREWREHAWRERAWREHAWRERHGYYGGPVVVTPGYGYYTAPGY